MEMHGHSFFNFRVFAEMCEDTTLFSFLVLTRMCAQIQLANFQFLRGHVRGCIFHMLEFPRGKSAHLQKRARSRKQCPDKIECIPARAFGYVY